MNDVDEDFQNQDDFKDLEEILNNKLEENIELTTKLSKPKEKCDWRFSQKAPRVVEASPIKGAGVAEDHAGLPEAQRRGEEAHCWKQEPRLADTLDRGENIWARRNQESLHWKDKRKKGKVRTLYGAPPIHKTEST